MGKFLEGVADELILYVRHLAYLSAVPKPKGKVADADAMSRLDRMKTDGVEPELPFLPDPLMLEWLMEVGPVEAAGMDRAPISWREIDAWQARTGLNLPPWQAKLLRRLSAEFLAESRRAEDPGSAAPYAPHRTRETTRASVADRLRSIFSSRAKG